MLRAYHFASPFFVEDDYLRGGCAIKTSDKAKFAGRVLFLSLDFLTIRTYLNFRSLLTMFHLGLVGDELSIPG